MSAPGWRRRHRGISAALAGLMPLAVLLAAGQAGAAEEEPEFYRVVGVAEDDMLNLRRGPGVQFETIVGLPNGREVNLLSREIQGSTEWCLVSLRETPQLQGFVACHFLGE